MLLGGALVNALVFSGSNYLFTILRTLAMTKSASVTIKQSSSCRPHRRHGSRNGPSDFINEELRQQGQAVKTFRDVDAAMQEYAQVTGHNLDPLGPEPQLADFYFPSDGQKDREIAFVILGMAATGLVAYRRAK